MAFQLLTDIANLMFNVFGGGAVLALVIIGMIVFLLLKAQANISVILVVLIPVIVGFILNTKTTNFIYAGGWVLIPLVLGFGTLLTITLWAALR